MAITSLILFVVVIALGVITKKNTGIIGLAVASLLDISWLEWSLKKYT